MKKVIVLFAIFAMYAMANVVSAEQPFAPKAKSGQHHTWKQKSSRSHGTWYCSSKNRGTNRKGLVKKGLFN